MRMLTTTTCLQIKPNGSGYIVAELPERLEIETKRLNSQELVEYQFKIQREQLEAVNHNLKKQLEAEEVILKSKDEEMKQLQTVNESLTKRVQSLNRTVLQLERQTTNIVKHTYSGDAAKVRSLVEEGTNVNVRDDSVHHFTPLITAAMNDYVEVARVLLEAGANLEDTASSSGNTALHQGSSAGRLRICRLFLDKGAKLDAMNFGMNTPLHLAAVNGHLSVVKLLVERGADVHLKNAVNDTPRDRAWGNGKKNVVEWLDSKLVTIWHLVIRFKDCKCTVNEHELQTRLFLGERVAVSALAMLMSVQLLKDNCIVPFVIQTYAKNTKICRKILRYLDIYMVERLSTMDIYQADEDGGGGNLPNDVGTDFFTQSFYASLDRSPFVGPTVEAEGCASSESNVSKRVSPSDVHLSSFEFDMTQRQIRTPLPSPFMQVVQTKGVSYCTSCLFKPYPRSSVVNRVYFRDQLVRRIVTALISVRLHANAKSGLSKVKLNYFSLNFQQQSSFSMETVLGFNNDSVAPSASALEIYIMQHLFGVVSNGKIDSQNLSANRTLDVSHPLRPGLRSSAQIDMNSTATQHPYCSSSSLGEPSFLMTSHHPSSEVGVRGNSQPKKQQSHTSLLVDT
ncbi:Ankyrin repeat domain-containing protein 17 [Zootermopsis nevadensis]|uniref:Ankyrin repeat domain-containing protein 17 n=1 Tax=Zootermopsis nevadensis TaxID=136037 RepID=A0A067R4C8_ZOONE|nr:Ankyrin repeat domain-containing protein 17 [Zootermopsis nevadensis]